MASNTTLTVRLKPDIKERLSRMSASTNRSRAFLAAKAIEAYVMRESGLAVVTSHGASRP